MTIIPRDEIAKGNLVEVVGYGGFAEVLHIEQDGYAPPRNEDSIPVPMYRVTVKWGPNNSQHGTSKQRSGIEDFALGRLRPPGYVEEQAHEDRKHNDNIDAIDNMDVAAILARLAELNAQGV